MIGSNKKRRGSSGNESSIIDDRKNILTEKSDFFMREAYKTLRTNVNFSLADAEGCKVLLMTSSFQGEGKSITALNLAISLVEDGNRVLLVDCDLRRPKLGRLVQIARQNGLSDLLINPELLKETVCAYREGLDIILAGRIPPNPSELLGSQAMANLILSMRKKYDYIILDTPPVNMVTDSAVLAGRSDGVLFVVRANQSERGAVIHAVEQLDYVKAKVLGFILNGVSTEGASYGKYRYKRYGHYGYGRYKAYGYGYESAQPSSAGDVRTEENGASRVQTRTAETE